MKKFFLGLMAVVAVFILAGCQGGNAGDDESGSTTVTNNTTYNVEEGGKVVIFNNDGDVTGCYDLDLNGSECSVETNFEGLYEPPLQDEDA